MSRTSIFRTRDKINETTCKLRSEMPKQNKKKRMTKAVVVRSRCPNLGLCVGVGVYLIHCTLPYLSTQFHRVLGGHGRGNSCGSSGCSTLRMMRRMSKASMFIGTSTGGHHTTNSGRVHVRSTTIAK